MVIKKRYFSLCFLIFLSFHIKSQNEYTIELQFANKKWLLDTFYSTQNADVMEKGFIVSPDSIEFLSNISYGRDYKEFKELNGNFIETQCHKKQSYKIDSVINNKEIWITTWDNINNECSKIYFLLDYPFLFRSTLKNKVGIVGHFTGSVMYLDAESTINKSPKISPKLKIIVDHIDNSKLLNFNYNKSEKENIETQLNLFLIAFENLHLIDSSSRSIVFKKEKFVKTSLKADIRDYYFNNYEVIFNGLEIPVFTDIKISHLKKSELLKIIDNNCYSLDEIVAIFNRFNPGRERIVNKMFGEEINCQVQSFEVVTFKDLMKRIKRL